MDVEPITKEEWFKLSYLERMEIRHGLRGVDVVVAEKILGYIFDPGLPNRTGFWYPPELDEEIGDWPSKHGYQVDDGSHYVPRFTEDIVAAWQVLRALIKMGWHPHVWYEPGVGWTCELLSFDKDKNPWVEATAETEMLAICRAALKAVEEAQ